MARARSKGLKRAERLFRRRRYSEVIRLLEPQVFMYRDRPRFYYYLGVSCLHNGDFGGAYSYLQRAQQLDAEDSDTALALAAIAMRRRQTDLALRLYLSVLDQDPKNRVAKRGLAALRRAEDESELAEELDQEGITRYLPSPGAYVPRPISIAVLAVLLSAGLLATLPLVFERVQSPPPPDRDGVEVLELDRMQQDVVQYEGEFEYVMSADEIRDTFELIGRYFNEHRDNEARREINRVLHSNAQQELKERARMLSDYLRTPSFTDLEPEDSFSYDEVMSEPRLYDRTFVRWRGRVANLETNEEDIRFDFLVGYEDERVLEGIVPARVSFSARVEPAMPVELIGQVIINNGISALEVTSIRRISP